MANVFDGRWQVFDAGGTNYASYFPGGGTVSGSGTLITVTNGADTVEYEGTGLAHDGTVLTAGTITKVIVKKSGVGKAVMESIAGHQFLIDTAGFDFLAGAATYNQLLSGDNLIVGSTNGTGGTPELLDGGAGNDTFQPGNGHTTINDLTGVNTLDVSLLTGPTTVNLNAQTFTVGGVTGNMTGISRVIGTTAVDTIVSGADGDFDLETGGGNDIIDASPATALGASFDIDAGAGDDTITISPNSYGFIDGGDGNDTVIGGGDLRFYTFRSVETLENTFFLRVRTEQLRQVDQITDSNLFNGDQVEVELNSGGTVDFRSLMAPGLSVKARALATGTNINGTDEADDLRDEYTGLIPGTFKQSTITGFGGDDTIFNNNSVLAPLVTFSGNMADYTITSIGPANWQIVDNRPGSPDGTDTLNFFSPTDVVLRFRDHTATINEQIAYKADNNQLPAQIYNGKLEFFGPDNFDYENMLPTLAKAQNATLTSNTTYTVNYQGGIRLVFEGTGLSTSSEFVPNGGSVTQITVYDTSIPGALVMLARLPSDAANSHLFRVPFTPDLLTGGADLYQRLLSGNNDIHGGPNDDLVQITNGIDNYSGTDGFDTLIFGPTFISIERSEVPIPPGGIFDTEVTYTFVDDPGNLGFLEITTVVSDPQGSIERTIEASAESAIAAAAGEDISGRAIPNFINSIVAITGGDPHITTLDGLSYGFQGLGEFVLSRSTVPGDPFEIQIRTIPFPVVGLASVVEQTATMVGTDRVSFDASRANVVLVNGLIVDLATGPVTLDGGTLSGEGPGNWSIVYDTGETLTVSHVVTATPFLSLTLDAGSLRAPDTLQGILGDFDGDRANEYQLEDGTVLSRPLSKSVLYGAFADAWRVEQAESLLDYDLGESTATFTNRDEPVSFSLQDLPETVLAAAEALVDAAGIADLGHRLDAIYDYVVTGDAHFIDVYASLTERYIVTADIAAAPASLTVPMLGVIARDASLIEAAPGSPTSVTFDIYRAGPAVGNVTVDWEIIDPGAGYFDAADFVGGVLPSGSVSFATGETVKSVTVSLAEGSVDAASEHVQIEISTASAVPIIGPHAQAEVVNRGAASGDTALPEFVKLAGAGNLTRIGDDWTLDLGTIAENTPLADIRLAVINAAGPDGNDLSGLFDVSGNLSGITGASTFLKLAAGGLKGGIVADIDATKPGAFSSVLTLHASESNDTGYSATLGDHTLTINVTLTDVPDTISGTAAADTLAGEDGIDFIFGLAGNDTLSGLAFDDMLTGGTGKDRMTGGAGADDFDFNTKGESGRNASTRDVIVDFERGIDDIDLSTIDARSGSGNQRFTFIKTRDFTDKPGQLRYEKFNNPGTANDKTIVEADINGDGRADFQIELSGLHTLTNGDFVL